ncbi:hypothetical protein HHI36_020090 [Cryptolaemus montrouzieri]|uniref:Uncharacterized protein n=1 Tax=Cryptolaemus montrouzieri TaxID=559131 RepID=A0ABD2N972_9CUCU
MCRIGDIGKGVLKQKMNVTCILKVEKQELIGPGKRNKTTDSFSSEDKIPLAKLLSPKKKATTTTTGMKETKRYANFKEFTISMYPLKRCMNTSEY